MVGLGGGGVSEYNTSRMPPHAGVQSLPATPSSTNVRTFTDYSSEHTRLTTLHGSTGALEVNNLGGFKLGAGSTMSNGGGGGTSKFANALESSIDGIVRTTNTTSISTNSGVSNGGGVGGGGNGGPLNDYGVPMRSNQHLGGGGSGNGAGVNGGNGVGLISKHMNNSSMSLTSSMGNGGLQNGANQFHSSMLQNHLNQPNTRIRGGGGGSDGMNDVDDMSNVFSGLSFKEQTIVATQGYGRFFPRRFSAPVTGNGGEQGGFGAIGNGYGLWGNRDDEHQQLPGVTEVISQIPTSRNSPIQQFSSNNNNIMTSNGAFSAGLGPHPGFNTAWTNGKSIEGNHQGTAPSIWSQSTFHHSTRIGGVGEGTANGGGGVGIGGGNGQAVGSNSNGNLNSRPNSETSSYSDSSLSGVSPSPTTSNGFFASSLEAMLMTTAPLGMEDREARSPYRIHVSLLNKLRTCVLSAIKAKTQKSPPAALCRAMNIIK